MEKRDLAEAEALCLNDDLRGITELDDSVARFVHRG
jgi:hypothetical protein